MKKITFMLALFMASLCSVTAWAAEREMPTAPVAPLTSGNGYYMYNLDAGLYNNRAGEISLKPDTIFLSQDNNGNWALLYWEYGYRTTVRDVAGESYSYSVGRGSGIGAGDIQDVYQGWGGTWNLIPTEENNQVFRIQLKETNSMYNKDYYWGVVDQSHIRTDQTAEQQTRWYFIPANAEGDRYVAEMNFFNALKNMEVSGDDLPLGFYENAYANRKDYTTEEITAFVKELITSDYISKGYENKWYNENRILITSPDVSLRRFDTSYGNHPYADTYWDAYSDYFSCQKYTYTNDTIFANLNANVNLNEASALYYEIGLGSSYSYAEVYIDDVKVRTIDKYENLWGNLSLCEQVNAGEHRITFKIVKTSDTDNHSLEFEIHNLGIMASSEISVNLKEPGSLGTEVLYYTDHIKNVRRLKVKGTMNDDDWAKLKMMSRLQHVDLSEAVFTEIPEGQFRYANGNDTTMQFLRSVVLPEGLKTIHERAFYGSRIENINIPSTVELVNTSAFYNCNAKELSFPADTKFEGSDIFGSMYLLKKVVLPKNLETIPSSAFRSSKSLTEVIWPDSLKTISNYAFNDCYSLQHFSVAGEALQDTMELPFVETIGDYAFYDCKKLKHIELRAVKTLKDKVFANCTNLTYASVNADVCSFEDYTFSNCPKLSTLKLYSPTVVSYPDNSNPAGDLKNVTLQVPHYLVNSYKLDDYWYNAKIEGFDYSDMTYIPIRQNLTLNSERFDGKPAIEIFGGAYLKINGSDAQAFQDMKFNVNHSSALYGQLLNNSNAVTQEGELKLAYYTKAKKWYFITLPFDLDIAKITHDVAGTQYAIRSYDGATRAINGATGNWKNIDRTTTIPAGTGFIFQTNVDTWSTFFAAEGSENLAISTDEFEKTLEVNASTENSHKGWNLVGNPYQCFYNNHMLNFTAPITVWDVDKKTYAAYSITDDDYALRPNEAFFIQCPNEENNTISFPLQGRQLSSVINSQNAVKANGAAVRKLVDLALTQNGMEDKTRVVFNDNASLAYETSCDAGKFMSMEADVPQIYTLDAQANTYAINERPFADGIVQLGIYVAKEGTCTFSAPRNSIGNVYLVDNKEGTIINLREQDYTFQSEAGTIEGRFSLCLNASGTANGIGETLENATDNGQIYDLGGRSVSKTQKGVYVVRKAGKSEKVMVK